MTFNTDMPFMEFTVMSADHPAECLTDISCDTVLAGESGIEPDASAPERRPARVDGRSRRFRFGDAVDDAPPRAITGSIAISFAVVSRRNWPR